MSTERPSIRDITTQLENSDGSHVKNLFAGKFEEERLSMLPKIRKLNQADIKAGTTKSKLDIETQDFNNPSISISLNGKSLYADEFHMETANMWHSNSKDDVVPADRPGKAIDPAEVRGVTTDLENFKPDSLEPPLQSRFLEERVRYLDAILKVNQADLKSKATKVVVDPHNEDSKWSANQMYVNYYKPEGFSTTASSVPHRLLAATFDMKTLKTNFMLHEPGQQ